MWLVLITVSSEIEAYGAPNVATRWSRRKCFVSIRTRGRQRYQWDHGLSSGWLTTRVLPIPTGCR